MRDKAWKCQGKFSLAVPAEARHVSLFSVIGLKDEHDTQGCSPYIAGKGHPDYLGVLKATAHERCVK